MRLYVKFFTLAIGILVSPLNSLNQSDGCSGVPTLTMGIGSCASTAFSLPGTFSNGGLVTASCALNNNRDDGWFSFTTGPSQTSVNIEETSTNRRHLISIWTACGGGTELGCDQSNSGITNTVNLNSLSPSTTYFIQIQRRSGNNNTASISGNICVYEPTPTLPVPEDCEGGTTVCSSSSFSGNSSGSGNVTDLTASNSGCLSSGEHESSWYYFSAATSGSFEFTIATTSDYDFAVWGPFAAASCPINQPPIRCSYSGFAGNTGLQLGAGDNTEGASGDAVVEAINATAGEVYILLVDNYSADANGFNLNWNLSSGATLDCTPLPIQMSNFYGTAEKNSNTLQWETKSENNSKEFIIEKSLDGFNFEQIGKVLALGQSSISTKYLYRDKDISRRNTYYRLKMVDLDLTYEYSHITTIKRNSEDILILPNPTYGPIYIDFSSFRYGDYTISYTNMIGEELDEYIYIDETNTIHQSDILEDKTNGIYFIRISNKFGELVKHEKLFKR